MENPFNGEYKVACVIVNSGLGSKVLSISKHHGIKGGTVFLGKGTVKTRLLDFLDLTDVRKEIVIMLAGADTVDEALKQLSKEMSFNKPNHGIAFCSYVSGIFASRNCVGSTRSKDGGIDKPMYNAIYTIVEKGAAEDVIDAATSAGSRGGTIIGARGSGVHETSKLFAMEIEPEKEIVLILSSEEGTDAIVSSIRKNLKIEEPGKGIIFVQPLSNTYGLYENN